jgi:hypothetical protein
MAEGKVAVPLLSNMPDRDGRCHDTPPEDTQTIGRNPGDTNKNDRRRAPLGQGVGGSRHAGCGIPHKAPRSMRAGIRTGAEWHRIRARHRAISLHRFDGSTRGEKGELP